jgi:hypothetical protein
MGHPDNGASNLYTTHMRWPILVTLCAAAAALISLRFGGPLQAQVAATTPGKDPQVVEGKGLPPRAAPSDYAAHVQAGVVTIAADFTGHSVGTQEGLLTTQDYVVIEAGVFGPPEAKLMLSIEDFSLRINGGKKIVPRQPYELVVKSLKDPDYQEPESNKAGKTVINTGGKADGVDPNAPPPAFVPVPFEVRHGWELRVKRDSLPIGGRTLPQAGLLFFSYGGAAKGIRSVELMYSGPAGKATLLIHP